MPSPVSVELPEKLTIVSVDALHEQFEPLLQNSAELILSAESVARVDTAGLQIMASVCQSLRKQNISFSWSGVPEVLRESAAQLGMTELISLPE
jgi:anti-anti-sigma regulatory factor